MRCIKLSGKFSVLLSIFISQVIMNYGACLGIALYNNVMINLFSLKLSVSDVKIHDI